YRLDEGALRTIDPEVVVTQDLCAVCAVDVANVDDALSHLGCTARVVTIDPMSLDEVLGSIAERGLEPAVRETYENGVRHATFFDPDGNEVSYGGAPAE
ncbi:MAG TPA: hypothetical protein VIH10_00675, partial [Kribbella sp.]